VVQLLLLLLMVEELLVLEVGVVVEIIEIIREVDIDVEVVGGGIVLLLRSP